MGCEAAQCSEASATTGIAQWTFRPSIPSQSSSLTRDLGVAPRFAVSRPAWTNGASCATLAPREEGLATPIDFEATVRELQVDIDQDPLLATDMNHETNANKARDDVIQRLISTKRRTASTE